MKNDELISLKDAIQAHPEFLNEQHEDHDKAIYAKGWNACISMYIDGLKELGNKEIDIHSADIETLLDAFRDAFTRYCDYANKADNIDWSQEKEDEAYAHCYEIREEIISRYEKRLFHDTRKEKSNA